GTGVLRAGLEWTRRKLGRPFVERQLARGPTLAWTRASPSSSYLPSDSLSGRHQVIQRYPPSLQRAEQFCRHRSRESYTPKQRRVRITSCHYPYEVFDRGINSVVYKSIAASSPRKGKDTSLS